MAKGKGAAGKEVINRAAYSRVSFLYQAAALLATAARGQGQRQLGNDNGDPTDSAATAVANDLTTAAPLNVDAQMQGMSRRMLTQMRAVSLRTKVRLPSAVKQSVCKYCDTLLIEGSTCVSTIENRSRGARKPWADTLVVACLTCSRARRYPVSAPRQPRRPFRGDKHTAGKNAADVKEPEITASTTTADAEEREQ